MGSIDSEFMKDLEARGLVKQTTAPELASLLSKEPITLYCGFDPTADSLHVGSLLPLLTLRRFQRAGHRVIAVVGGATGMIGDPSGKSQERSLQGPEQLAHNVRGITAVMSRFLDLQGPNPALVLNNADWFQGTSYIDFLRDVGKHFTVNHMIAKESVRARLEDREHGISYTEFSYMLLQAYDFYVLNERKGCRLQIGGSDQWGNITAGIELIRRMRAAQATSLPEAQRTDVYGMTQPLVMRADGGKFGKTEQGTVWLDAARTSPYALYQFFIQTADSDAVKYLNYFTFLPREEIDRLAACVQSEPEKREAQRTLAREMTLLIHGQEEFLRVEKASSALFGAEIRELDERTLRDVMGEAPSTAKDRAALTSGIPLVDLLAETGLCPSKGQARKDVTAGGIYVNNERVSDAAHVLTEKDLIAGNHIVLRKGKKSYHLLRF